MWARVFVPGAFVSPFVATKLGPAVLYLEGEGTFGQ